MQSNTRKQRIIDNVFCNTIYKSNDVNSICMELPFTLTKNMIHNISEEELNKYPLLKNLLIEVYSEKVKDIILIFTPRNGNSFAWISSNRTSLENKREINIIDVDNDNTVYSLKEKMFKENNIKYNGVIITVIRYRYPTS